MLAAISYNQLRCIAKHTSSFIPRSFVAPFSSGSVQIVDFDDVPSTKLRVHWHSGESRQYLATWLRDHDPVGIHPESKQRQSNSLELISGDTRPSKPLRAWIEQNRQGETLNVEWASSLMLSGGKETPTTTSFPKEWLLKTHGSLKPTMSAVDSSVMVGSSTWKKTTTPRIWGLDFASIDTASIFSNATQHSDYMNKEDTSGFIDVLGRLRRDGFAVVSGCPTSAEGTEETINRLGFVRRTMYSDGVWDTAPRPTSGDNEDQSSKVLDEVKSRVGNQYSTSVVDTAYTNLELYPHTDCTYYRDPPALQFFNCAESAPVGGATWIVDGFAIATYLKKYHRESYEFFTTQMLPFHCIEPTTHVETLAYPFKLDESKEKITQFRYNNDDRAPLKPELFGCESDAEFHSKMIEFYENHLPNLLKTSQLPSMACELKLKEGDMLIVNNHRVLHGRRTFKGPRNMIGAYVGLDEYESACRLHDVPHDIGALI